MAKSHKKPCVVTGPSVIRVPKRCGGKYVAKRSLDDDVVIASSNNMARVIDAAHKKGVDDPIVMFIPKGDTVSLY